ncbi:hypothetical protein R1flu_014113 [Riccia fluitans]|uniref:Uncharacterized protein n=1 Tax=Riccia fluitans TaxID=41844 RepID=A0ABD1YIB5_9MARC
MMGLITEEGESSSSGMSGSSTDWHGTDLDLPEALYSPDSRKFFEYIERLMADNQERTWSPHHIDVIDMLDSRGTSEDYEKFYQVDEGDMTDKTGDVREHRMIKRKILKSGKKITSSRLSAWELAGFG